MIECLNWWRRQGPAHKKWIKVNGFIYCSILVFVFGSAAKWW